VAAPPSSQTHAPPLAATTNPYRWVILGAVWWLYACFGMMTASLAPLVQPITRELDISHSAMGAVLGAWPLVYIVSATPCGALTDRFGPRRMLMIAMLVIAVSGLLRGTAGSHLALFLAVAFFGLGGPLVSIGAPKLVSLWFDSRERPVAVGIYSTGSALGVILALSLTNSVLMPLMDGNWRHVIYVYSAMALFACVLWLAISHHPAAREMERHIAAQPRVSQLGVIVDLLRLPAVRYILAISVGVFFFNHGLNNWLPEILRTGGMDPKSAGYWASIPTAIGIGAALVIPRLATPQRRFAVLGGLLASASVATLMLHSAGGIPLLAALTLQGIARGSLVAVAVLCLMEARDVGNRHAGSASGLFFSAGEIGGVLGPLTIGILYDATGGFAVSLYLLTGICAILLLLLGRLRRASA